jgi:acyl-CoA thioester hydrolase
MAFFRSPFVSALPALPPLPRDPRLTQRSGYTHWVTERVRWSDTDQVGHVNNLSFSTYCETGRTEFLAHLLRHDLDTRVLMLVAQMNVCFLGEAHWPSEVMVGTCILEIGKSSCRMGQALFVGERCICTADTLMVHVDVGTHVPGPIPAELRQFLTQHLIA